MCIFFPRIIKIIPKPGEWMVSFKFFLGLLLLISTGWFLKSIENKFKFNFYFFSINFDDRDY